MVGTPAFIVAGGSAIAGLVTAFYLARWVMAQDAGPEIIQKVGRLIQEGSMAFLRREYMILAVFASPGVKMGMLEKSIRDFVDQILD